MFALLFTYPELMAREPFWYMPRTYGIGPYAILLSGPKFRQSRNATSLIKTLSRQGRQAPLGRS